jgi:S1-C subfamily serine protease
MKKTVALFVALLAVSALCPPGQDLGSPGGSACAFGQQNQAASPAADAAADGIPTAGRTATSESQDALAADPAIALATALSLESAVTRAIASAEVSVVAIARERYRDTTRGANQGAAPQAAQGLALGGNDEPAFFSDRSPEDPEHIPHEFGSGVVIDRGGLVLTNYHVLGDPGSNRYWVWSNKRPFPAELVAADPWTDLAVLKIAASDLKPIPFGEAKRLRKGQFLVALGNPYAVARDGQASATWGILSNVGRRAPHGGGRDRIRRDQTILGERAASPAPSGDNSRTRRGETLHEFGNLLQLDMRLQWGTSGGAVVNLQGELVGLTSALAALEGYEANAGFAIPVDDVFRRAVEALKGGKKPEYGFLGIAPELLALGRRQEPATSGVLVRQIVPGTPASRSELRQGDVITHVADVPVFDSVDLVREVSRLPADSTVSLTVTRRSAESSKVPVLLSKKYVGDWPPAYSRVPEPRWRGLQVDFATAIPRFEERIGDLDPDGCVAVVDVIDRSPAWMAGLRPGMFISHVESQRVARPSEFFNAVAGKSSKVTLRVTTAANPAEALRTVAADP